VISEYYGGPSLGYFSPID